LTSKTVSTEEAKRRYTIMRRIPALGSQIPPSLDLFRPADTPTCPTKLPEFQTMGRRRIRRRAYLVFTTGNSTKLELRHRGFE
jgi:hypothetical protein